MIYAKYDVKKFRTTVGATCGRLPIHSKLKTGEHSSPLRYVVVCTVSFATAFGCLSLTVQLLLFRKNHARLACSVVNALTTARCRYQLLRITDNRKGCPTQREPEYAVIRELK